MSEQPPPLNAPPTVDLTPGIQPGTTNVVIANFVIVFGPAGTPSGVFVYRPGTTPGLGNPPVAWMTGGTADPYGNAVSPEIGDTNASGTLTAVLNAASLTLTKLSGVLAPPNITLTDNTATASSGTSIRTTGITTPVVTAIQPGTLVTETYHPLSLGTGWAARGAGFATPSFRMKADGDVELAGEVVGTNVANTSVIANSLGAGYFNASNSYIAPVGVVSGAAAPTAGQTFRVSLTTTGTVAMFGIATTGNYTVSLDGVSFPVGAA